MGFLGGDESDLKLIMMVAQAVNILKLTQLHILKGPMVWNVILSIKRLKKGCAAERGARSLAGCPSSHKPVPSQVSKLGL